MKVVRVYYLSALEPVRSSNGSSNQEGSAYEISRVHLKEVRLRVEEALRTCLLPSLQLIPANLAVGHEIWEVMSLLPYEVNLLMLVISYMVSEEKMMSGILCYWQARQVTKTLMTQESIGKDGGKTSSCKSHDGASDNCYSDVSDAFQIIADAQLEYDILEYVVIERLLQSGRAKLKDDGINLSDWLQSLASFWGHLCKKYPSMELRDLFQYLVNQLKRGQGIELVLLQVGTDPADCKV
ncbi:hypothetical protein Bca52824_022548 [Brassica carinata]|uniref:THO complex subunitTHOC2 N-terminal domain-containing protein n=1 Tax=Brassica carinata TaxID=52824 RepID=A0A8X7VGR5_BRACI|nr:hypothetical protein Bca52824_022548 [Brassica carinata]